MPKNALEKFTKEIELSKYDYPKFKAQLSFKIKRALIMCQA